MSGNFRNFNRHNHTLEPGITFNMEGFFKQCKYNKAHFIIYMPYISVLKKIKRQLYFHIKEKFCASENNHTIIIAIAKETFGAFSIINQIGK